VTEVGWVRRRRHWLRTTAGVGYVATALLALAVAAGVFTLLESSQSTACFRDSVEIPIAGSDEVLEDCELDSFDAVRAHIAEQRTAATSGASEPEETDELAARSALIVWMTLFAATAGFALIVGVQSAVIISQLKPKPSWRFGLIARSAGAAMLAVLPFALFRLAPYELSDFDDLHRSHLKWLPPLIGLAMLPAVIALVAIWHILATRADLELADVARLGSRMRRLVGMLGAALALAVLTTAARWEAIATLPGGDPLPSIVVLLWGSTFALGLAAIYVPVHERWAAQAARLISDEVRRQLPNQSLPGTVGYRAPELALTKELHTTLGVGGPLKSLQGSVAVLAPVIAAAVSSLFS
jgi:hypothetical protein